MGGEAGVGAGPRDHLDVRLLEYGRAGGLRLRMADVYARFRRPGALLRRKLVLMLALLEMAPPTHRPLNTPRRGSGPRLILGAGAGVVRSAVLLAAGLLVFRSAQRSADSDADATGPEAE